MTDKPGADTQRIATDAGLTRLSAQQLAELTTSVAATRLLLARLPKDLHWSEEPAPTVTVQPSERGAK